MKNLSPKNRNILICLFIVFLLAPFGCYAGNKQGPYSVFYKAGRLYEQGEYDAAISEYNNLSNEGFESGNLYYNLGNCYFKKGSLGKAILYYEKARRLIPRDKDLESNYKFTRSLIKRKVSTPAKIWIARIIDSFLNQFTVDGLTIVLSGVYMLFVAVIIISVVLKLPKIKSAGLLLFLLGIFIISAVSSYKRIQSLDKEAVIMNEKTDALFEPFEKASVHFILYEGMKVYILSVKDSWCKARRLDGKVGWIKLDQLEVI